jgi:YYY domain-containing protein
VQSECPEDPVIVPSEATDPCKLLSVRNIVTWILVVEILGLAVLPALRAFFANRRDAALLSRPVGLALAGWGAWALSLATPLGFSPWAIYVAVLLLVGISLSSRRGAPKETAAFWGSDENRGALYFWIPTAIFLLIRAAVPEILGAEKFMDLAFYNSLARGPDMPPADPWMSGNTINYYYWGYLLAATISKAAGIDPLVGYNLAVATFAGLSFAAAACLGFRLSRGRPAAALGAGFASVFAGNLTGAFDAWTNFFGRGDFDYWHASRVIGAGDTINEFPFFTFFHADLHPHLLAFPFFLSAFAVADRWIEAGTPTYAGDRSAAALVRRAGPFLLIALLAGTATAANLWNTPAIAILLVFAGMARTTRGEALPRPRSAFSGALTGAVVFGAALALTYPYRTSFELPYNGIARAHAASGILEFLGVWGILFAVAAAGLLALATVQGEDASRRRDLFLAGAGALSVGLALASKSPALAPILFLGLLAGRAAWKYLREKDRPGLTAAFLCFLAVGIIAGCEIVYFKDSYGDKLHRMNTIFKFYIQAWPLLGIGAVALASRAWDATSARRRRPLALALLIATVAALLYPAAATLSRLRQKDGPFSLDARRALGRRDAGDLQAIEWLRKNASSGTVVLEATGDPYSEFARISSHTGIPTVLGWANHESLWRAHDKEVMERLGQVRLFYTSGDPAVAQAILRRYGVTHVILGGLERRTYPGADSVAAFPFLEGVEATPGVFRVSGLR